MAGKRHISRKSAPHRVWALAPTRPKAGDAAETRAIVEACEAFIETVLKPRFLPVVTPTAWNYVVDLRGAWRAGRYRFIQRYRSGMAHNKGFEFDAPFARIDRIDHDRFDIKWMRHNDTWWPIATGMTLTEALHELQTNPVLYPHGC